MSESHKDNNKGNFTDILSGLSKEHKALVQEQNKLKREEVALIKEETELKETQRELLKDRLSLGQALLKWTLMLQIVESKVEKIHEKKKALQENKVRVESKISLFEDMLPSSSSK